MAHRKIIQTGSSVRKISQEDFAKAMGAKPFTPTTDQQKAKYLGQTSAEAHRKISGPNT